MSADIASLLPDLTPWQRQLAEGLLGDGMVAGGRRSGRSQFQRMLAEAYARDGRHIHVASRDGTQWGLTHQPVGYLYARIPRGVRT